MTVNRHLRKGAPDEEEANQSQRSCDILVKEDQMSPECKHYAPGELALSDAKFPERYWMALDESDHVRVSGRDILAVHAAAVDLRMKPISLQKARTAETEAYVQNAGMLDLSFE